MNTEEFAAFKYEIENWNNIPITSRLCGVGCVFCKLTGDPAMKRFPLLPDISIKELEEGFKYIDKNYKYVRLGAGVMVATKTDPFLHPDILQFIKRTAEYFPDNMITTVTTGSYIDIKSLDYLNNISNYRIDLSLNTLQKKRALLMKKVTYEKVKQILMNGPINKISLMFTGDMDDLKRDLEDLINMGYPERGGEILVRRLEHTKYSPDF